MQQARAASRPDVCLEEGRQEGQHKGLIGPSYEIGENRQEGWKRVSVSGLLHQADAKPAVKSLLENA